MTRYAFIKGITGLLAAVSCSVADVSKVHKKELSSAYEKARASMIREASVAADVLWGLNQIQSKKPDRELRSFVDSQKKKINNPHFLPGVFPDAPRITLPDDLGSGIVRFFNYVKAPFSEPADRALSHLSQFIEEDQEGYILTHQFFCLLWAEQSDLPLPEYMKERRQQLVDRIYQEQVNIVGVDSLDLYMERTVIILLYGDKEKINKKMARQWMDTIVDLQKLDGSWPVSKTKIHYDGSDTLLSSPRSHTTVLAMMALSSFADNQFKL